MTMRRNRLALATVDRRAIVGAAPGALPNACAWDTSARTSRAYGAVADAVVALALGQAGFELENALNEVAAVEELIGALVEQAAPGASRGAERAEGR
jgi:hypothetical protein